MNVDLSALPTHVTLRVGDRVVVALPSYADSGNVWSATCLRGREAAQVVVRTDVPRFAVDSRGDGRSEPPPLFVVPEHAVVSGLSPGEATWRIVLARSFGPPQEAAAREIRVTVTERA
jgi:hypothetical protein